MKIVLDLKVVMDTNVFIAGVFFSGDRHLLKVSGYQGIEVLKPRELVDRYFE
jgi:predicted nucleic acid-binding protein